MAPNQMSAASNFAKWGYDVKITPTPPVDALPADAGASAPLTDAAVPQRFAASILDHTLLAAIIAVCIFWLTATGTPWSLGVFLAFIPTIYFIVWEGSTGQTIGKRWCGVEVTYSDGRPLNLRGALVRNVLRYVDALPTFYALGLLSMLSSGSQRRQRLGDRAANTIVVPKIQTSEYPGSGRLVPLVAILGILVSVAVIIHVR